MGVVEWMKLRLVVKFNRSIRADRKAGFCFMRVVFIFR